MGHVTHDFETVNSHGQYGFFNSGNCNDSTNSMIVPSTHSTADMRRLARMLRQHRRHNVGLMLYQRRRRWPNIETNNVS